MSSSIPAPAWRRTVVLALILGAQLMMVLDTSIVTTALPRLEADLGFTPASLSWVQNAYVLAFGGLLLLGARAGDLAGRRRIFMIGVGVFAALSLLVGLSWDVPSMLTGRILQGLASAFAIPSTLALLVGAYPEPKRRAHAIAIYSAVIGAGASVGIIVGGVFTDLLSWRWGLLINVPIGLAVLLLSPASSPRPPPPRRICPRRRPHHHGRDDRTGVRAHRILHPRVDLTHRARLSRPRRGSRCGVRAHRTW